MKLWISLIATLGIALGVLAQSTGRLPQEQAREYAKACVERAANVVTVAPLRLEVDLEKACAERGEGGGAMVVPDKQLSEKALAAVDKDVLPLGQLWLRKWTLVVDGKPLPEERLRILAVHVEDKDRPMPLFFLGLRKKGADRELAVYALGGEPVQVVPLKKLDQLPSLPLTLEWSRGEKDSDNLTLNILGKYEGVLHIGRTGK